jgi:hypothetical protein
LAIHKLERLKKCCSQFGARIFGLWRGFGEGAGLKDPATEPKRSQSPKRPLLQQSLPNGYNIFDNTLLRDIQTVANRFYFLTETSFWRIMRSDVDSNEQVDQGRHCVQAAL